MKSFQLINRSEVKKKFTTYPNRIINDSRISWDARAILMYLLSKKDNWIVQVGDLIKKGNFGRDKIYRILKELEVAGYIVRFQERDSSGKFRLARIAVYDYRVTEEEKAETIAELKMMARIDELYNKDKAKVEARKKALYG